MVTRVLLVTPSTGFGELIRQTLEDDGGYDVVVMVSGADALSYSQNHRPDLAILDSDIKDISFQELGQRLLSYFPDLHMIVVPPGNDVDNDSVQKLAPQGFLTKPFYLPNLLEVVGEVLGEKRSKFQEKALPRATENGNDTPLQLPPWLQDVNKAAQYLTRLSLETASQAALITRNDMLWAYAGEFPQPVAEELADAVSHYWGRQGENDLARFIHLESTGEEYMLYATGLAGDLVLSLVFDASTPFSKIRSQANHLAKALSSQPDGENLFLEEDDVVNDDVRRVTFSSQRGENWSFSGESTLKFDPESDSSSLPSRKDTQKSTIPDGLPKDWQPYELMIDEVASESERSEIKNQALPSDWQPDQFLMEESHSYLEELLDEALLTDLSPADSDSQSLDSIHQAETQPSKSSQTGQKSFTDETIPAKPSRDSKVGSQPEYSSKRFPVQEVEPLPGYYNLTYACVLVPRFPNHHLTSELASRLGEWIPQICVAFGWRVEHLSIRPEYTQWMVSVPPATSPGYLMRIIRKVTSQRIFMAYPGLQEENPSGEFWAPGYLIISSSELPPPLMVKNFIAQTRKRQGINRP